MVRIRIGDRKKVIKSIFVLKRKKYDRTTVWQANGRSTETLNRLRKTYTNSSNRIYAANIVVVFVRDCERAHMTDSRCESMRRHLDYAENTTESREYTRGFHPHA